MPLPEVADRSRDFDQRLPEGIVHCRHLDPLKIEAGKVVAGVGREHDLFGWPIGPGAPFEKGHADAAERDNACDDKQTDLRTRLGTRRSGIEHRSPTSVEDGEASLAQSDGHRHRDRCRTAGQGLIHRRKSSSDKGSVWTERLSRRPAASYAAWNHSTGKDG